MEEIQGFEGDELNLSFTLDKKLKQNQRNKKSPTTINRQIYLKIQELKDLIKNDDDLSIDAEFKNLLLRKVENLAIELSNNISEYIINHTRPLMHKDKK